MPRSVSIFHPPARLAGILIVAACGSEPTGRAAVEIRDSADVRIVENPATAEAGAWHLTDSPRVEIGGLEDDPNQQVYQVWDAVRLTDDRIVVVNGGTHELRFYDASGRFMQSAGREGEGPGEFRSLASLERFGGDSLLVWDRGTRRLSIFDSQGRFVRSFRLRDAGAAGSAEPIGRFPDGALLARRGGIAPSPESGVHRDSTTLYRFGPDGALADSLGRHPYIETFVDHSLNVGLMARPFGRHTSFAVARDGYLVATADRYEIRLYDAAGQLRRSIRKLQAPRPLTAREIEDYRRRRLESIPDGARDRFTRVLDAVPFPETRPPYERVMVARTGHIWVAEGASGSDATEGSPWTVLDPDGRIVAMVRTPSGFYPFEIGRDYVLGRARDELDVESVRLYGLSNE